MIEALIGLERSGHSSVSSVQGADRLRMERLVAFSRSWQPCNLVTAREAIAHANDKVDAARSLGRGLMTPELRSSASPWGRRN